MFVRSSCLIKIKYACRKTLADSRPRIRGRFARNDEAGEIHKTATFHAYEEDEDDFWVIYVHILMYFE